LGKVNKMGRQKRAKAGKHYATDLGTVIRRAREEKQVSQTAIGEIFRQKLGTPNGNARISCFELGKAIPTDAEVTILAQSLGLSVASLREKRDLAAKQAEARRAAGRKRGAEKLRQIRAGKLAPKTGKKAAALVAQAPAAKRAKQAPAGAPALADFVELIDEVAPMPSDKEERRLWFAATMELFKIGQSA
jgi:transcriptional regulator with XRE-family HTH domain